MARKYVTLAEVAEKLGYTNLTPTVDLTKVKVYHRSINRPAFQLAGFYDYFDTKRIQVVGRAENEYLKTLTFEERVERVEKMFSYKFPGIILARGIQPPPEILNIALKYDIPVLSTDHSTALVIVEIIRWINEQLAETTSLHGVLVDVFGEGILITGASGIGKSETAIELVKRGHRLVADDVIEVLKIGEDLLMGKAPELTRHLVELRGIGVVDIKSLYGVESVMEFSPINMIINLEEWDGQSNYDRLGLNEDYTDILGVKVVSHTIPIRPGRNLAIIIETAAVNNRQKNMGYNAAQALCDRVSEEIHKHKEDLENGVEQDEEEE
ncbi:MAG: HPr(Ser) kinase/phosphatase [Lachnospiraceae bacterium]|nr:HPr(Ser) kinase/phosphatase [Lachnospiraceae bacterium]